MAILAGNGINTFIIPYSFTNQNYAEKLRRKLIDNFAVEEIVDTTNFSIFDNASVKNIILRLGKKHGTKTLIKTMSNKNDFSSMLFSSRLIETNKFMLLKNCRFETKEFDNLLQLKGKIDKNCFRLEKIFLIAYGVRVNHKKNKERPKSYYVHFDYNKGYKPFTEGKEIDRYFFRQHGWLDYRPKEHYNPMFPELFENEKIMFINVVSKRLRFAYDDKSFYNSHTIVNCVRIDKLRWVSHPSVRKSIKSGDIQLSENYSTCTVEKPC